MLKEILENAFIKILGLHPSATRGEINNVYAQAEAEILKHYVAKEELIAWAKENSEVRFDTDERTDPRYLNGLETIETDKLLAKLEEVEE